MSIIPSWAHRFGKAGLILVLLSFAVSVILEEEIQIWWKTEAKPFLIKPVPIEVNLMVSVWQIFLASIVTLLVLIVGGYAAFSLLAEKEQTTKKKAASIPLPIYLGTGGQLDSTHITNAVVDAEIGNISRETLAEIVVKGVNSNVITKQAAKDSLERFGFELVELASNKFAYADTKRVIRR